MKLFLFDISRSRSIHFFDYAQKTQPRSLLHVSPYKIIFHKPPRNPLKFQSNLSRNGFCICAVQKCSDSPSHSQYQATVLIPLSISFLLKPISAWLLAIQITMKYLEKLSIRADKNLLC